MSTSADSGVYCITVKAISSRHFQIRQNSKLNYPSQYCTRSCNSEMRIGQYAETCEIIMGVIDVNKYSTFD
jgi:hypothetical protein